jgi:MerR family transcriptional regulator, light-induced transcriptional regulator
LITNEQPPKISRMPQEGKIQYPIRAAARITGISLDTLRAWERRYRAVTPARGARGRVYTDSHLIRLKLLKEAVSSGNSIGDVASMGDDQLRELIRRSGQFSRNEPAPDSSDNLADRCCRTVLQAIANYDQAEVSLQLGRMGALLAPRDFVYSVILPLMRSVGEGWSGGSLTIAQEHLVSACLRNVLGNALHASNSAVRTCRFLIAAPSGESHEFGMLAAGILAAGRGFGVVYLGANLPADEILRAADRSHPAAVVLGISSGIITADIKREVAEIGRRLPRHIELWIGGPSIGILNGLCSDGRAQALTTLEEFESRLNQIFCAPA